MAPTQALQLFHQLITLAPLRPPEDLYQRLWIPLVTLWYLIWQWLQPRHTLQTVVHDARRGGADQLCPQAKPLSKFIKSRATTAYSNARQRLPLEWISQAFSQLAAASLALGQGRSQDLPVELLDGSTKRLRPYGDIPQHFPPHPTCREKSYWCVARVLVSFCAVTGIATAALIASIHVSEQALAVQLMLQKARRVLYVGDRNFGVWRVVRAAVQSGGHVLMRLTQARTRRLLDKKCWPAFLDLAVQWSPTSHDQVDSGLEKKPVQGRLIIIKSHRRGYRPQTLYFFTTLLDADTYPPQELLKLYGWRWQVELNFRVVKSSMQMDQSEAKSADMARKEFYAGLMAYNLIRGLMATASAHSGCRPAELSFTKVHGLLAAVLTELFLQSMSDSLRHARLLWLLTEASAATLHKRRKPRPNEPRAQYHKPQGFPKMKSSREEARDALKKCFSKS